MKFSIMAASDINCLPIILCDCTSHVNYKLVMRISYMKPFKSKCIASITEDMILLFLALFSPHRLRPFPIPVDSKQDN